MIRPYFKKTWEKCGISRFGGLLKSVETYTYSNKTWEKCGNFPFFGLAEVGGHLHQAVFGVPLVVPFPILRKVAVRGDGYLKKPG